MHRPARPWWLVAAALACIGSGCLVLGLQEHQHPLAGPVASLPNPVTSREAPTKGATTLATVRSMPLELRIPAISLSVSLGTLGLNSDGTVQVPTVIQQPGWYRLGPSPGQIGSAVILGHVDSSEGPAVFFKLRSLVAGDIVNVALADGVVAKFRVSSVATFLKTSFPDDAVYTSHGYSALQLVTCGGAFDTQTGHYLSNVVVFTSLVGLVPTPVEPTATTAIRSSGKNSVLAHS